MMISIQCMQEGIQRGEITQPGEHVWTIECGPDKRMSLTWFSIGVVSGVSSRKIHMTGPGRGHDHGWSEAEAKTLCGVVAVHR